MWCLRSSARKERLSVSFVVRDMPMRVRKEDQERYWARDGESRLADFEWSRALTHRDVWKQAKTG